MTGGMAPGPSLAMKMWRQVISKLTPLILGQVHHMSTVTILPIRLTVNGHDSHNSCYEHLFHLCQSLWKRMLSHNLL